MNETLNNEYFVKGDALAKLIELVGKDKKELVNRTDELTVAIDEVRKMFATDELTECTWDELIELANSGSLEPGHKYKITDEVEVNGETIFNLTLSANSNSSFETIGIANDCLVHVKTIINDKTWSDDYLDGMAIPTDIDDSMFTQTELGQTINERYKEYSGAYLDDNTEYLVCPDPYVVKTIDGLRVWAEGSVYLAHSGTAYGLSEYFPNKVSVSPHDIIHFDDVYKAVQFAGMNTTSSLTSVPVNKSTVYAELTTDQALSWAEGLENGREVLVIAYNKSDADITITLPLNCNEETIVIPTGKYIEISLAAVNNTYYTRVPEVIEFPGIEIGEVKAGEPGEASATITGDPTNMKLNITIPKGDKGEDGTIGKDGEKGDKGDTPELSIGTVTTAKTPSASINNDDPTHPVIDLVMPEDAPYVTEAQDDWKTSAVGGVAANMSPDDPRITGKTVSQMIDMLIYPTLQPSAPANKPSVTLTYGGNATSGQVITIDITTTKLPAETAITKTADRGSVAYTNAAGNKFYAGASDKTVFTITDDAWGQTPSEKRYTVTYSEHFTDGPKLLDNKGGDSTTASFKAATKTAYKYFDAVYPIYANTNSISDLAKQTAKDYINAAVAYEVSIPAETTDGKFKFAIPSSMNAKLGQVYQYNPNSGKYDKPTAVIAQGIETVGGVDYNVYVRTVDPADSQGASKYQINLNKK